MKENILFKRASKNLIKLTDLIQSTIKGTVFENKVCYVGGCIRDLILGIEPKNIDIAVNKENGGLELAYFLLSRLGIDAKNNVEVISSQYGARIEITNDDDLKDFEIRMTQTCNSRYLNEDREPSKIFGTFVEDALRRDFTINALYWNMSQEALYDFTKRGLDDLKNRIIRCTSCPSVIFAEDPSRIIRGVRFANEKGWGIESETWLGMIENTPKLGSIDFCDEFIEVLLLKNPTVAMKKLYYCGALEYVVPDVYDMCSSLDADGVSLYDKTLKVMESTTVNLISRLAALFHNVDKVLNMSNPNFAADVAKDDVKYLGFSVKTANSVSQTIRNYKRFDNYGVGVMPTDRIMRRFMNNCGDCVYTVVDLMNASYMHDDKADKRKPMMVLKKVEELKKMEEEKASKSKLPINGKDIMKEFKLKKGPHIGILLDVVKDAFFENPKISKDECFNLVRDKIHTMAV